MPARWSPRSRAGSTRAQHGGRWLVRIEDLDPPREVEGAAQDIVATLAAFGMESDEPVLLQSERGPLYQAAFDRLEAAQCIYGCACSRSDVELAIAAGGHPGRLSGDLPQRHRGPPAARLALSRSRPQTINFVDRAAGPVQEQLELSTSGTSSSGVPTGCGRISSQWSSTTRVQSITDVVRGADLLDNTPRQIALQRALVTADAALPARRRCRQRARREAVEADRCAARSIAAMPAGELERAARHLGLPHIGADDGRPVSARGDGSLGRALAQAGARALSAPTRPPSRPRRSTAWHTRRAGTRSDRARSNAAPARR